MRWRGVLSLLLLALAWLALDDITTDNATGAFVPEYSLLVVCGVWFAGMAAWLLVRRRPLLAIASLLAVALAVIAFWSLPHHYAPASPSNYLGLISLGWFLALAIWLAARRSNVPQAQEAAER
jgi:peptidoglycan/LPS O-acetylase OafA/YrhL